MGGEREDRARRFLERLAALDADGAAALVSDDFEGVAVAQLPLSGERRIYRGRAGLRDWVAETAERWGEFKVERLRFREYGGTLLVVGENRMRGQRSPFGLAEQRRTLVTVFRFDGDLIKSVHAYARYDDALSAEELNHETDSD
jgi:ketosteroid isomerase-like protein